MCAGGDASEASRHGRSVSQARQRSGADSPALPQAATFDAQASNFGKQDAATSAVVNSEGA